MLQNEWWLWSEGAIAAESPCYINQLEEDETFHSIEPVETHQTSSDVLDGFLDVHARPVIQYVTDTSCAVDKADVILTSFWHGVETESQTQRKEKKQNYKSVWGSGNTSFSVQKYYKHRKTINQLKCF